MARVTRENSIDETLAVLGHAVGVRESKDRTPAPAEAGGADGEGGALVLADRLDEGADAGPGATYGGGATAGGAVGGGAAAGCAA